MLRPLAPASIAAHARRSHRWPVAFAPRCFGLLAAGLLLIAPAWIDRRALVGFGLWNVLVLAVWAVDVWHLPAPDALVVRRRWRGALALGVRADVELELQNESGRPIRARLVDEAASALRREFPDALVDVPGYGVAEASYAVEPRERGDLSMGAAAVRYRSPWGIGERWASAPIAQVVRVYPDLHDAQRQAMFLVRSRQIVLEKRRVRATGLGRDFESLREYREGDEPRHICWTATARRGRLVTRVYQPERSQAVWIVVDGGRLLRARAGRHTKMDSMVNAALALSQVALTAGDRAALLTYGRRIHTRVAPGRGPQHLRAIVEALATVPTEPVEADHAAAAARVLAEQKQRALVVWLTDLAETAGVPEVIDSAARLARRHVVVVVVMRQPEMTALAAASPPTDTEMYRVTAAQETLERREVLLSGLRQRGALALELSPTDLTAAVVDQYLSVKERNLI
jgi:uncharacterized protein (DUF58 family)